MRGPYTQLYLHLVWATWDRLPLITPVIEARLYTAIAEKSRALVCVPLAVGGVADHLHVLVSFHPTVSVAALVKDLKGSSSHLITHELAPDEFFKWQGSYGAFTLGREVVPLVKRYIAAQKEHHASGDLRAEWEQTTTPDVRPPGR